MRIAVFPVYVRGIVDRVIFLPLWRIPENEWHRVHGTRRRRFIASEHVVLRRLVNIFTVIREVEQETIRLRFFKGADQRLDHIIVVQLSIVVIIVDFNIAVTHAVRNAFSPDKFRCLFRITKFVFHVST